MKNRQQGNEAKQMPSFYHQIINLVYFVDMLNVSDQMNTPMLNITWSQLI
jgi:hypothetical protein